MPRGSICEAFRSPWLLVALAAAALVSAAAVPPAAADRVENGVAVFAALDKVTARISKLEVPLNETVRFGSLKVTPRVCYSRPPTEPPKTTSFVEVNEVQLNGEEKRLFTGWMLAESPGLNAVEHPVFDVWLTQCVQPVKTVSQNKGGKSGSGSATSQQQQQPVDTTEPARRRVRR
jgi:hypothetical protein